MAWQTPKTDWSAADGVRDTDFNRIEENIRFLREAVGATADRIIYVKTTGNDATGTGDYTTPFATVTKALSVIPKNLDGKEITIDIAAGSYNERLLISGFNGLITLQPSGVVTIQSLTIDGCSVYLSGYQLNCTNGIVLTNGATFEGRSAIYIGGNNTVALSVQSGSAFVLFATLTVSNSTSTAIEAYGMGRIYVATLSGSNNKTGMLASNGGVITYGSTSISATTARVTNTGGRIYTEAQTSMPNY